MPAFAGMCIRGEASPKKPRRFRGFLRPACALRGCTIASLPEDYHGSAIAFRGRRRRHRRLDRGFHHSGRGAPEGLECQDQRGRAVKIPTVGVGEATTAAFRVLLKHFGIDEFEFFRKTEATFKLGIRHEDWRRKGFTYYGPIDDPHQVVQPPPGAPSDYLNVYAIAAGRPITDMHLFGPLLEQKKAPYAKKPDGSLIPLGPFHHAYHFDQALVGEFFASKSKGVEIVDAVVSGVQRDPETGDVTALDAR